MVRIQSFELLSLELPFRKPFKHAAAARSTSDSLFLRCTSESGTVGWGEALPRKYVTGETRDGAIELLRTAVLPKLIGRTFASLDEVHAFLVECNGCAPADWVDATTPQTAAWCAVDLALLDTIGRELGVPAFAADLKPPASLRYSGVMSAEAGPKMVRSAWKMRFFGLSSIKLKVEETTDEPTIRSLRRAFGRRADLRTDANMAWSVEEAKVEMEMMSRFGVTSFEQPVPADDFDGLAELVATTGLGVMADESLGNARSMDELILRRACTAANVRISKCGGLVAAAARCREALDAGLTVQVGCQVGETSLLSAAHLALIADIREVRYLEGCFGTHLLREDPVRPELKFGWGGKPPRRPTGPGLGVEVDEDVLRCHTNATVPVEA